MTSPYSADRHPNPEAVARFLDGRLEPEEQRVFEQHLTGCPQCRDELVEVGETMRAFGRRRFLMVAIPAAAAASVAAILLPLALLRAPESVDRLRTDAAAALLHSVEPVNNARTSGDSVRFVWSASVADANFTLTVTDSVGSERYQITTGDTTVTVPRAAISTDSGTFLWFVDALFGDGRSASTAINRFHLR